MLETNYSLVIYLFEDTSLGYDEIKQSIIKFKIFRHLPLINCREQMQRAAFGSIFKCWREQEVATEVVSLELSKGVPSLHFRPRRPRRPWARPTLPLGHLLLDNAPCPAYGCRGAPVRECPRTNTL